MDKKTGIFYGSNTGTTARIARKIGQLLNIGDNDIHDVAKTSPSRVAEYDVLILGSSTWGSGDIQTDWLDFVNGLQVLDLKGKKIALFGCGDETMSDTFCNAVGELRDRLVRTQAILIGEYDAGAYEFSESAAYDPETGKMYGLVLDEVNHPELTDARLHTWTQQISEEIL
ncbi:MAG: flavodoxin [Muribaculaceae bacterium]|nr:flavodoxin [Muribaculaceae bacterium]MDE6609110.1 flavodoxin [Muribaculaceae bacterium]